MKVRIEIDTKTFIRFWLVMFGFAAVLGAIYSARTALIIVGAAFFLTLALNGPVNAIAKRIPGKSRTVASAVAFVLVIVALVSVALLAVPPIIQQTSKLVATIPGMVESISQEWNALGSFIDRYDIQPQIDAAVKSFQENATTALLNIGQGFITGATSFLSFLAAFFLMLVMTFLMLVEGPKWLNTFWGVYGDPDKMKRHRRVARRMYGVVAGYVNGQVSVSGIGAIFAALAVFVISFFFDSIPASLALPTLAITFVLTLIPMFGATIAGILMALLLGVNDVAAAIIYVVYFIVYQQIENNFISPTVQSKFLELSPLTIIVSVTIGLYLFGIAGGIISIPIAGSVGVLVDEYFKHQRERRTNKEKPAAKLLRKIKKAAEDVSA